MSEVWSLSALNITNCRPVGLPYSDKSYTKLAEMKSWWWMMKCYIDCLQSPVFLSQPAVNNGKYLIRGREGRGRWPDTSQSSQWEECGSDEKVQRWVSFSDSDTLGRAPPQITEWSLTQTSSSIKRIRHLSYIYYSHHETLNRIGKLKSTPERFVISIICQSYIVRYRVVTMSVLMLS